MLMKQKLSARAFASGLKFIPELYNSAKYKKQTTVIAVFDKLKLNVIILSKHSSDAYKADCNQLKVLIPDLKTIYVEVEHEFNGFILDQPEGRHTRTPVRHSGRLSGRHSGQLSGRRITRQPLRRGRQRRRLESPSPERATKISLAEMRCQFQRTLTTIEQKVGPLL